MKKNQRRRRVAIFFVTTAVVTGGLVLATVSRPAPSVRIQEDSDSPERLPISVVAATPEARRVRVRALGEVTPQWTTTIPSMVDGALVFVHPRLLSGTVLPAGETIARIDDTRYAAELADARSSLAAATMQLEQAVSEAEDARLQWERSGRPLEEASPLALKQPQVDAASAGRIAAERAVTLTEHLLSHTDVTMPYTGVVLASHVSPGTAVSTGSPLATVATTETVEIGVALDTEQWRLLDDEVVGASVDIIDAESHARWTASIDRVDENYDTESRQRRVWVCVERPLALDPPLRAGLFVSVEIPGRVLERVLTIPESALTRDGLVWFVDDSERLVSVMASPIFYSEGEVVIAEPARLPRQDGAYVVASKPNSAFVNGTAVTILSDERGAQ